MNGLYDYKEERLSNDFFRDKIDAILDKRPVEKFERVMLGCLFEEEHDFRNAAFKIIRLNADLKWDDIELYRWSGHASEQRILDDRVGYFAKCKGITIWTKLVMLS